MNSIIVKKIIKLGKDYCWNKTYDYEVSEWMVLSGDLNKKKPMQKIIPYTVEMSPDGTVIKHPLSDDIIIFLNRILESVSNKETITQDEIDCMEALHKEFSRSKRKRKMKTKIIKDITKENIITKLYRLGITISKKCGYEYKFVKRLKLNNNGEYYCIFDEDLSPNWQIFRINKFLTKLHDRLDFTVADINDIEHIYKINRELQ